MFPAKKIQKCFVGAISVLLIASCTEAESNNATNSGSSANYSEINTEINTKINTAAKPIIEVFKSSSCGCCKKWITHISNNGFEVIATNSSDLSAIKQAKGIAPRYRSCHTGVSEDGYVFEGHVPAKFVQQFLLEKPANALGLSVPAMPVGSPGMEMGDRFMPYRVLLLKTDGSSEVYAKINTYKEQF